MFVGISKNSLIGVVRRLSEEIEERLGMALERFQIRSHGATALVLFSPSLVSQRAVSLAIKMLPNLELSQQQKLVFSPDFKKGIHGVVDETFQHIYGIIDERAEKLVIVISDKEFVGGFQVNAMKAWLGTMVQKPIEHPSAVFVLIDTESMTIDDVGELIMPGDKSIMEGPGTEEDEGTEEIDPQEIDENGFGYLEEDWDT